MTNLSQRKRRIVISILSLAFKAHQSMLPITASSISGVGSVIGDSVVYNASWSNIYNIASQTFNIIVIKIKNVTKVNIHDISYGNLFMKMVQFSSNFYQKNYWGYI